MAAVWRTKIRLAPCFEQNRITARIEALFGRLADGIEALNRVETSVERYRASVLKAAVEGRLTARWRKENPPDETGGEFLRRLLAERRKCWEQEQLPKFADSGRRPPGNWKSKYKEPIAPDTRALPELPEGWCWATVDQVGDVGSGITKGGRKRAVARRPVPYLRVANVQRGGLDLREIKTIPASENEVRRYSLRPGDVLFNEGGDRDKLGRGCVWRGEIQECLHQNHVFRVRPFLRDYSPDFLSHYGNSSGQEWFFRRATQSVNLASINQTVLRSLPVPVPPAGEQEQIVARVAHELATWSERRWRWATRLPQPLTFASPSSSAPSRAASFLRILSTNRPRYCLIAFAPNARRMSRGPVAEPTSMRTAQVRRAIEDLPMTAANARRRTDVHTGGNTVAES
jgi:type I restriction enzyme S subunit